MAGSRHKLVFVLISLSLSLSPLNLRLPATAIVFISTGEKTQFEITVQAGLDSYLISHACLPSADLPAMLNIIEIVHVKVENILQSIRKNCTN